MIAAKQKFFVTGIIELTPKTLQNYGFVNIGLTPPPPLSPILPLRWIWWQKSGIGKA